MACVTQADSQIVQPQSLHNNFNKKFPLMEHVPVFFSGGSWTYSKNMQGDSVSSPNVQISIKVLFLSPVNHSRRHDQRATSFCLISGFSFNFLVLVFNCP